LETNGSAGLADLRDLDLKLALERLHPARAKAVAQPLRSCAARADRRAGAHSARAQPRVELVLDRALDDQPRPEPGQLRQRLARVLTHPTASSRSICSSISADGGTVRLTA
jgi:hypothetical protein